MPEAPLLDAHEIRQYLREVAELLGPEGSQCVLVVVGGSLLALRQLRPTTRDVDSMRRLDEPLRRAASEVAHRHGLPTNWLNDNAAPWWPIGLTEDMCTRELEHGRLLVLAPPLKYLFVMKLEANRVADQQDLRLLWPHSCFSSAEEAAALWHSAYPHHEADPYLADYISRVIEGSRT